MKASGIPAIREEPGSLGFEEGGMQRVGLISEPMGP